MSKMTVRMILQSLRKCFQFIGGQGLIFGAIGEITGSTNVNMSYSRFTAAIEIAHKVTIVGWPSDIDRVSPQSLTKAGQIKDLYLAWKDGSAHWRKLSAVEHRMRIQDAEEDDPKLRKKRADAGGKHKRRREVDEEEPEAPPSKKSKKDKQQQKKDGRKRKDHRGVGYANDGSQELDGSPVRKAKNKKPSVKKR